MIKVLLVEDDEVFRIGLTVTLRQANCIELVGVCRDGQSVLSMVREKQPDLVLMDIGLPVMDGIQATRSVKALAPHIKVLVLTSHDSPQTVDKIMNAGADGFCLKGISSEKLISVMEDVCSGIFWVDAAVAEQLKQRFQQPSTTTEIHSIPQGSANLRILTEREQEVLGLIAQAKKNLEIAEILSISPGTVRVHVHSILHKLKVKNRREAVEFLATCKDR